MRAAALAGAVLLGVAVSVFAPRAIEAADACASPVPYPGDAASTVEIADWMARGARSRAIPAELPVMAALVESGLKNLKAGDSDSVGFFAMRTGIWDMGPYAGFPTQPELQLTWFLDQAIAIRAMRVAAGDTAFGTDPATWGDWIADVERPAQPFRGRYQLRLDEARGLIAPCDVASLQVTTAGLPLATVGSTYRAELAASGGSGLTWSLAGGALPDGVALTPEGVLSGTPTAAASGPVALVFAVASGSLVATRSLLLDVVEPLTVATPKAIAGERGRPLRPIALLARGGRAPYTWQVVAAPVWLALDQATTRLTGTPPLAGAFPVRVALRDAYATATVELVLNVRRTLRLRRTPLPAATAGRPYRARVLTIGGVRPFRWRARELPTGVTLDPTTGRLGGRPAAAGRYRVSVTVADALGASATVMLRLTVRPPTAG
jgi:hypothetical protein